MGRYIQTPEPKGKVAYLCREWDAQTIARPRTLTGMREGEGRALVVVVDNGPFEAAAYIYDEGEFQEFVVGRADDARHKTFLSMDREIAEELAK